MDYFTHIKLLIQSRSSRDRVRFKLSLQEAVELAQSLNLYIARAGDAKRNGDAFFFEDDSLVIDGPITYTEG